MYLNESALGREYLEYCDLKLNALKTKVLNLSNITQFCPTLLLLLGIFIRQNKKIKIIAPKNNEFWNFFNVFTRDKQDFTIKKDFSIIAMFPERYSIEKKFNSFIFNQNIPEKNYDAFSYFISEFIDNIYEHSKFSVAYLTAQQSIDRKFIEIAIVDNGISIPGSYEIKGYDFDDKKALEKALTGLSTKDDYRGYGLRTSLNILIKGFEAKCLIVSRRAALYANNNISYFKLEKDYVFNGTLISTRLYNTNREVNVYDFIE